VREAGGTWGVPRDSGESPLMVCDLGLLGCALFGFLVVALEVFEDCVEHQAGY
jgi:hypothetical protein